MPYTIRFALLPMGHAAGAAKDGESVSVQPTDFTSTEDGQRFIKSLEAFPNDVLQLLSQQCGVAVSPSQVDNLLVIVNKDLTATVYLNEVRQVLRVRASRTINAGEPVAKNDIVADIDRMELGDISIAPEAGVLFLFSVGWRKGLFYDFAPLNPITVVRRTFDCAKVFAQLYAHVLFQERFSILESEWDLLFRAKLFPFAGFKNETIESILSYLRAGWDLCELSDTIVNEVKEKLCGFLDSCASILFLPLILQSWSALRNDIRAAITSVALDWCCRGLKAFCVLITLILDGRISRGNRI